MCTRSNASMRFNANPRTKLSTQLAMGRSGHLGSEATDGRGEPQREPPSTPAPPAAACGCGEGGPPGTVFDRASPAVTAGAAGAAGAVCAACACRAGGPVMALRHPDWPIMALPSCSCGRAFALPCSDSVASGAKFMWYCGSLLKDRLSPWLSARSTRSFLDDRPAPCCKRLSAVTLLSTMTSSTSVTTSPTRRPASAAAVPNSTAQTIFASLRVSPRRLPCAVGSSKERCVCMPASERGGGTDAVFWPKRV